MKTNKKIKREQLFNLRNELQRCLKDFKEAQEKFLIALNQCALSEALNEPKDKQKKALTDFKSRLKIYFMVFRRKTLIEIDIENLQKWEAKEPIDYESKFIEQA